MGRHVRRQAPRHDPSGEAGVSTLVFGRTKYAEPLVQQGTTDGEDVLRAFPGEWVELVALSPSQTGGYDREADAGVGSSMEDPCLLIPRLSPRCARPTCSRR